MPRVDDPRNNYQPSPNFVHAVRGSRTGYGNIAATALPLDCREVAPTITIGGLTGTWQAKATDGNGWKFIMIAGATEKRIRFLDMINTIYVETTDATMTDSEVSYLVTPENRHFITALMTFTGAITMPETLGYGVVVGSSLRVWAIPTDDPDTDITITLTTGAAAASFAITARAIAISITEDTLSGNELRDLFDAQTGATKTALDALIGYFLPYNGSDDTTILGTTTTIPVNAASAVYEFSGGIDYLPVTRIVARTAGNVVLVGKDDDDDDAVTYTLAAGETIDVFPDKILSATTALTIFGL